uniref:Uncharacterized protein n=1 Tax=Corethron hystrix TaxID=216773 RepID=A0A7S1FXC8_9STRA|mmetsp:Transcript_38036/g.88487  ORF Transcript_38036/g.88487 Transcript_38036/m.88487 type:complete len:137 (+) Transcript_38036:55-465(+)
MKHFLLYFLSLTKTYDVSSARLSFRRSYFEGRADLNLKNDHAKRKPRRFAATSMPSSSLPFRQVMDRKIREREKRCRITAFADFSRPAIIALRRHRCLMGRGGLFLPVIGKSEQCLSVSNEPNGRNGDGKKLYRGK